MRALRIACAVISLASLGGCAGNGYTEPFEERHRAWWASHNSDVVYERREAERDHRVFCSKHPEDTSCAGWYVPL